jgi:hypothetical protein
MAFEHIVIGICVHYHADFQWNSMIPTTIQDFVQKHSRFHARYQWDKSSSCLRSLVCLKTRLIINVSKRQTFHGRVRH